MTTDPRGQIVSIDGYEGSLDQIHGVEFHNGILIPGLINTHTHLELSYLHNQLDRGGGFAGFASQIGSKRDRFSKAQMFDAAQLQDSLMWQRGVSAAADICNSNLTIEVKQHSRIKYINFVEAYGLKLDTIDKFRQLADEMERSNIGKTLLTPHSTYSLDEINFNSTIANSEILSLHFMESIEERELFRGKGALADWYKKVGFDYRFSERYNSPTDRVIQAIPKEQRVILVHNAQTNRDEIERLIEHFRENLTLALCPLSNLFISGEVPEFSAITGSGARVSIGTDSLASNNALSPIDELKLLPKLSMEQLLRFATINGAEALGIQTSHGSLEVGKTPGIVILDRIDWDRMALTEESTTRRIL